MSKEEKKLSIGTAIPVALQHVVAMVVGCVTVPNILASAAGVSGPDRTIMMQASLVCAAIAIFLQCFNIAGVLGSGLPVIVGAGFAFIPTLVTCANMEGGMSTVMGAQMVGSLFGIVFALFFKKIRFLFPPVVTASVVITIGISLYKTAANYMAGGNAKDPLFGGPKMWGVALLTMVVTLVLANFTKGVIKVSATLIGLIFGYIVAVFLGMVDFRTVSEAGIVQFPLPLHFGMNFVVGAIIPMAIIFVINAIQDIGQLEATSNGVLGRHAESKELTGGCIADCATGLIGSFIGGAPSAIAGQNVGIVITTGVTDRIVFFIASLVVLVAGLLPKVAALFMTIPAPVLGGATVAVFGSIAMTGVRMLSVAGITPRNLSISGLSVALAIGISQTADAFKGFPPLVGTIFSSPIVVVALVSIILNLVLPKESPDARSATPAKKAEKAREQNKPKTSK